MADYVVGPWEVNDRLTDGGHFPALANGHSSSAAFLTNPIPGEKSTSPIPWVTNETSAAITDSGTFIVGFHTVRRAPDKGNLLLEVLRFTDGPAAAAAASAIGAAILNGLEVYGAQMVPATIPRHPEAVAAGNLTDSSGKVVTLPGFESLDDIRRYAEVRSVVAHGPYVLVQEARSPDASIAGVEAASALVATAIDLQVPRIDAYRPTDPADFAAMPIDPTGLMARTLPVATDDYTVSKDALAVFKPSGALHFQREPLLARSAAIHAAHVDQVANGKAVVYQTGDVLAAAEMSRAFSTAIPHDAQPLDPIAGLPESRCFQVQNGKTFYCVAAADRYVVDTMWSDLAEARQMVSAQVAMLLAN
jgi:hypothetical protein